MTSLSQPALSDWPNINHWGFTFRVCYKEGQVFGNCFSCSKHRGNWVANAIDLSRVEKELLFHSLHNNINWPEINSAE